MGEEMAESAQQRHPRLRMFLGINAVYAGLVLGLAAFTEVRTAISSNWLWAILALLLMEAGTLGWTIYLHGPAKTAKRHSAFFADAIQSVRVRYGAVEDWDGVEAVYHEFFRPSLSMSDAEARILLSKGLHYRVADGRIVSPDRQTRRIVGYFFVWGLSQTTVDQIASGQLKERSLTTAHILPFDAPTVTHLYIAEICVTKTVEAAAVRRVLMADALLYGRHLLEHNLNLRSVCAWIYSEDGRRLEHDLGMQPYRRRLGGPRIAELSRDAVLNRVRGKQRFRESYEVRFFKE